MLLGVVAASKTGGSPSGAPLGCESSGVAAGITRVPSGPSRASKARTTVPAPPSVQPT